MGNPSYSSPLSPRGSISGFCEQRVISDTEPLQFNATGIEFLASDLLGMDLPTFIVDGTTPCNNDGSEDGHALFRCADLTSGFHTLFLTPSSQVSSISICFQVDVASSNSTPSVTTSAPAGTTGSATMTASISHISSSPPPSVVLPTSPVPSASTRAADHTVQIVAGTIGGALFVSVLIVAAVYHLLRLRRRRHRIDRQDDTDLSHHVYPFIPVIRSNIPRRTSSSSLEKASIITPSIAACTSPTSGNSEVSCVHDIARDLRVDPHTRPSKPLNRIPGGDPQSTSSTPWSAAALRQPAVTVPASILEILSERTVVQLIPPHSEDARSSAAPPLALPNEIERALSDAPPEVQSGVMRIVRSLFSQHASHRQGQIVEVDSGVRLVEDTYAVPPPQYTTE